MNKFTHALQHSRAPERGTALVTVLYGLAMFSVLSLTVLRNFELDKTLHTAEDPDLHVVLYAGGANSNTMIGRLNIPTLARNSGKPDLSTEVRIPGMPNLDLASELAPGWSYAVRLSPHARVCCDGGDNACAGVTWDEEITAGALAPELPQPIKPAGAARELRFALSSLPVPADVSLEPSAAASSAFLVRATRIPKLAPVPAGSEASQAMICRLESGDASVTTGSLTIKPGIDEDGRMSRISSGIIQLNYGGSGAR